MVKKNMWEIRKTAKGVIPHFAESSADIALGIFLLTALFSKIFYVTKIFIIPLCGYLYRARFSTTINWFICLNTYFYAEIVSKVYVMCHLHS